MMTRVWTVPALLVILCLAHGLAVTRGVSFPPDLDAWRDMGLAQAILDGDWLADPFYRGEIRHYPPLVPALAAGLLWLVQADDLPRFWVSIGVYAGTVPVIMFFLCARSMFGTAAAAIGSSLFVLLNSAVTPAYLTGGYSPWLLVPLLAQALFLGSLWLIHARTADGGWAASAGIGAAIGTTFLAHPVPGILLSGILAITCLATRGPRWRTLAWLALAGGVVVIINAPYSVLLAITYPKGIVHFPPGGWIAGLLRPTWPDFTAMLIVNTPLVVGLFLMWRRRAWPGRTATVILATWTGLCLLALARHYVCAAMDADMPACSVLRVPVHHFHLYLQVAAPMVLGAALAATPPTSSRARVLTIAVTAFGIALLFIRPHDMAERAAGLGQSGPFMRSLDLYRWIRKEAPRDVTFVTVPDAPLGTEPDTAPFIVMGAAKRLLVAHSIFSNPYVDWSERDRIRRALLSWAAGDGGAPPASLPCGKTWALLPPDARISPEHATLVHAAQYYRVFDLRLPHCDR